MAHKAPSTTSNHKHVHIASHEKQLSVKTTHFRVQQKHLDFDLEDIDDIVSVFNPDEEQEIQMHPHPRAQ